MADAKGGNTKTLLLVGAAAVVGYALYTSAQKKSGGGGGSGSGTATPGGGSSSDAAAILKDLAGLGSSIAGAFSKSKDSSGSVGGGGEEPINVVTTDTSGTKYGEGGSGYFNAIDDGGWGTDETAGSGWA